jgi:hypothetical protein
MRPSLLLLLILLLFLSLGSSSGTFVGCGSGDVSGFAAFGCSGGNNDDPCDYIVTIDITVLLDADSSPIQGATVFIDTGPPDVFNTMTTDSSGQAFWGDTAFLTGFSAECGGVDVGTVEPYDLDTSFSYDLLVTASGLASAGTVITVDRQTRDLELTVRMEP